MEQAARAHVVGLGALADLTRPHVSVDVARLSRPVGKPTTVLFPLGGKEAAANDKGSAYRAVCGGRQRVTTAVDGATHVGRCAFEDGAKKGVGGELQAAPYSGEAGGQ